MLVDQVKIQNGKEIIGVEDYKELRNYIKEYFDDLRGTTYDFLFEWEPEPESDSSSSDDSSTSLPTPHRSPYGKPLIKGHHHPTLEFKKWKNIRFDNVTKVADYVIDSRSVRICGSSYDRSNRVR